MVKICKLLYEELLKNEIRGKVISVFSNSFNILFDNKIITILNSIGKIQPYSIATDTDLPKVKQNDEIVIINNGLYLDNNLLLSFEKIIIYYPFLYLNDFIDKKQIENNFYKAELYLEEKKDLSGIITILYSGYEITKGYEYIISDMKKWIDYCKNKQFKELEKKSIEICGFGNGLTPSCDDFLAGVMLCVLAGEIYYGKNINIISEYFQNVVNKCQNKTNRISYMMLKNSSIGLCNEITKKLFQALFCNSYDLIKCIDEQLKIGHCSGCDMLCGIICAYKYYLHLA